MSRLSWRINASAEYLRTTVTEPCQWSETLTNMIDAILPWSLTRPSRFLAGLTLTTVWLVDSLIRVGRRTGSTFLPTRRRNGGCERHSPSLRRWTSQANDDRNSINAATRTRQLCRTSHEKAIVLSGGARRMTNSSAGICAGENQCGLPTVSTRLRVPLSAVRN